MPELQLYDGTCANPNDQLLEERAASYIGMYCEALLMGMHEIQYRRALDLGVVVGCACLPLGAPAGAV